MTRELVDVMAAAAKAYDHEWVDTDELVADLLTNGPAEHTIVCPTCGGRGFLTDHLGVAHGVPCPDCTDGRQTVVIRAEVQRT